MADLSLTLPVFVASPSDVMMEREAADTEIVNKIRDVSQRHLVLEPFRWEKDHLPTAGPPQAAIDVHLRRSELVVLILWGYMGEGTEREWDVALEQHQRGQTDNVMIYFKDAPYPQYEELRKNRPHDVARLEKKRREMEQRKLALSGTFKSTEEFRTKFSRDLDIWLRRWDNVPACCQFALKNYQTMKGTSHLGPERLTNLEARFDLDCLAKMEPYLGREAVKRYQRAGQEGAGHPLSAETLGEIDANWQTAVLSPQESQQRVNEIQILLGLGPQFLSPKPIQRKPTGEVSFADAEWFYYFCANGLIDAIQHGDISAVSRRPYLNHIHQYLGALVKRRKINIVPDLLRWLTNQDNVTDGYPVARDFAAYVLGMIGAYSAQDELARVMGIDPSKNVRRYCITSLGKLRSRRHFPTLARMFTDETDPDFRMILSQAVCNIVGIAPYEL